MKAYEQSAHEVIPISRSEVDLTSFKKTFDFMEFCQPDLVVDAAARVGGIGANNAKPVEFLLENLSIQNNLMSASHKVGVRKFIFLGSSCIYPRDCPQPIREEYLLTGHLESTNSAYAVAKIAGIELINSYRKEFNADWISLLPTNLYGQNDNFALEGSHVLPALIRKFVDASESNATHVTLWGTGKPLREFLHVEDVAKAVVIAGEKYSDALHLNIGSGEEISIKELAILIAELSGFEGEIVWDNSKPDGTPRKVLDSSRIRKLGWIPSISLREGIESTISWYRKASANGTARK